MGREARPHALSRRRFLKAGLLTALGAFVSAYIKPPLHVTIDEVVFYRKRPTLLKASSTENVVIFLSWPLLLNAP